mgnify:CR=1 FL=1
MSVADCRIRPETRSDARQVRAVHVGAFPTPAEANLVDRLRDVGRLAVSLVAECEDDVVGHVAFSPVTMERAAADVAGLGLAPLAVLSTFRRRGVGAALVCRGLDACRRAGVAYVVVLGEPAYYQRFGFQPAAASGIENEYGAHDEFMVLELHPGALTRCSGLVRYCEEFAELS